MEEKNQIKIKLTTVIVLSIIAIIIIVGIVEILLNNNIKSVEVGKEMVQNENKNEIENEDSKPNLNPNDKLDYTEIDFSFKFLKMGNKKENVVYSPLSINYALQMLNEGANGNTKNQIENVIGNVNLLKHNNIDNKLSLANVLYIRDTYSKYAKEEYNNILLDKYNAEIKYDAFKNTNNINSWIANKTFGQIKNMLEDEVVTNSDNKMFLINALAIDVAWKDKFDREDTYGRTFYLEDGNNMQITTMNKETHSDNVSYYQDENVTALAIELEEYSNEQMEFIAIMPNDNLADYVEKFLPSDFKNITDNFKLASKTKNGLDISIPRFSFDYDLSLEDDLKKLGITDAFESNLADFSNMSSKSPFWVGGVLHKANIDFTEEGIKAAAVTVIHMTYRAAINENKPIEIIIDKPFMYLIRDKKTNEIWFVGIVYKPNLWENDKANYE